MNKQVKFATLASPRKLVEAIASDGGPSYNNCKELMDKKCVVLNNNCIEYAYLYDGIHFEIHVSEENYTFAQKALEISEIGTGTSHFPK